MFEMRKDTYIWHMDSIREAQQTLVRALEDYEKKYPYRYGMKKQRYRPCISRRLSPMYLTGL